MRIPSLVFRMVCLVTLGVFPLQAAQNNPASRDAGVVTTVVLVRHAETAADDPRDPGLSPAGELRAGALAEVVQGSDVSAVYTTQYRRTMATSARLSADLGVPRVVRDIGTTSIAAYSSALAGEILDRHAGRTVVVVGHSNTVPALVEALGGRSGAAIAEHEYDRVFIVVLPASGDPQVLTARYGPPSMIERKEDCR